MTVVRWERYGTLEECDELEVEIVRGGATAVNFVSFGQRPEAVTSEAKS